MVMRPTASPRAIYWVLSWWYAPHRTRLGLGPPEANYIRMSSFANKKLDDRALGGLRRLSTDLYV